MGHRHCSAEAVRLDILISVRTTHLCYGSMMQSYDHWAKALTRSDQWSVQGLAVFRCPSLGSELTWIKFSILSLTFFICLSTPSMLICPLLPWMAIHVSSYKCFHPFSCPASYIFTFSHHSLLLPLNRAPLSHPAMPPSSQKSMYARTHPDHASSVLPVQPSVRFIRSALLLALSRCNYQCSGPSSCSCLMLQPVTHHFCSFPCGLTWIKHHHTVEPTDIFGMCNSHSTC